MGKGSVHVPGHLQGQEHAQGGESLERCQATLGQLSEGSGWQKTEKCVVKSPNLSTFSVRRKQFIFLVKFLNWHPDVLLGRDSNPSMD